MKARFKGYISCSALRFIACLCNSVHFSMALASFNMPTFPYDRLVFDDDAAPSWVGRCGVPSALS